MISPNNIRLYSDKSKSPEAYDLLSRNFDNVKPNSVSARLTELVLIRTIDPGKAQSFLDQDNIAVKVNDSKFALHLTKRGLDKALALGEAFKIIGISSRGDNWNR